MMHQVAVCKETLLKMLIITHFQYPAEICNNFIEHNSWGFYQSS